MATMQHGPILGDLTATQRDVLAAIGRDEGASGVELQADIEAVRDISRNSFYSAIAPLEERGLIDVRRGRQKTNEYRLSDDGREALRNDHGWRTYDA